MKNKFVIKITLSEISVMLKDLLNECAKDNMLEMKQINNKVDPRIPDIELVFKNEDAAGKFVVGVGFALGEKLYKKWDQDFKEKVNQKADELEKLKDEWNKNYVEKWQQAFKEFERKGKEKEKEKVKQKVDELEKLKDQWSKNYEKS